MGWNWSGEAGAVTQANESNSLSPYPLAYCSMPPGLMDNGPSGYHAFDAKLTTAQLISKQVETPYQLAQKNYYATPGTPLSNNRV